MYPDLDVWMHSVDIHDVSYHQIKMMTDGGIKTLVGVDISVYCTLAELLSKIVVQKKKTRSELSFKELFV